MKRKSSRYRALPFSAHVVKPIDKLNPSLFRFPFASEHSSIRVRKIFVIRQVQRLPATSAAGDTIQRILIFDDHPVSLRLVFGGADSHVRLSEPKRMSSLGVAVLWIVTLSLMIGIVWPIL